MNAPSTAGQSFVRRRLLHDIEQPVANSGADGGQSCRVGCQGAYSSCKSCRCGTERVGGAYRELAERALHLFAERLTATRSMHRELFVNAR